MWRKRLSPTVRPARMVNSGFLNGLTVADAKKKIVDWLDRERKGHAIKSTIKLRDWVFSRQRYWGEPIPMVKCEKCGCVASARKRAAR